MGLKKTQPQYNEEDDDDEDDDEDDSCSSNSSVDEEEGPIPQISVSSPTSSLNSVLQQQQQPPYTKTKTKHKKQAQEFSRLILAQTIQTSDIDQSLQRRMSSDSSVERLPNSLHSAIWTIKFSKDGKYLASAGQSCDILLWKVLLNQQTEETIKVLDETPFMEYKGHTADILELAWSKVNRTNHIYSVIYTDSSFSIYRITFYFPVLWIIQLDYGILHKTDACVYFNT